MSIKETHNLLNNKVAVITGASTGIGREVAQILATNGAVTILIGRNIHGLEETKKNIETLGGSTEIILADLSQLAKISTLTQKILKKYPKVDILANIAGVWHNNANHFYGPILSETPERQIINVINVTLMAPILLTRGLLPIMIKQKQGKIINISGTFDNGAKGWLHYYIAKKGVENFTVGLSEELAEHNIQVNCISPSDTATPAYKKFFPEYATSALDPKEVAKFALFLASPASNHITGSCTVIKQH